MRALAVGSGVVVLIAGCVEEAGRPAPAAGPGAHAALRGATLRTVRAPGAPDLPFGEALVAYSQTLGGIHAAAEAAADPPIHAAVLQLATILDRLPAAAAEPALRRAAARMRAELAAGDPDTPAVGHVRRALTFGATALLDLAESGYAAFPDVAARARRFAGLVEAIDPDRAPPDRAAVIVALVHAERTLAAMYALDVRAPSSPAVP